MGIRARFLKAECSLLAATVMLTPLMLCGCNVKPDATETETETETVATEKDLPTSDVENNAIYKVTEGNKLFKATVTTEKYYQATRF